MIDRTTKLTISLEAQQWDIVLTMLAEGPYRVAAPLIQEMQRQCAQQNDAAERRNLERSLGLVPPAAENEFLASE